MDKIGVGVLGFGTVGLGVVKIILDDGEMLSQRCGKSISLLKVADLDIETDRGIKIDKNILTTNADDVLNNPDIDIVVEVIGGVNPAKGFIEQALKNGKSVITSNKEVIAKHGPDFITLAKKHNVSILYEAAVAGGIPILHAIRSSLSANNIQKVFGIMNGTTNYILSKMEKEGAKFDDVLAEAQKLGYAEADPSADVDGYDVAYKLAILSSLAFRSKFTYEDIYFEGIRNITLDDIHAATDFGYTIKLLATGIDHGKNVELRVHPVMIENDHPLAAVSDSFNAVFVEGSSVGETMFYGRGAGEMPTASAVVGDIMELALKGESKFYNDVSYDYQDKSVMPMNEISSKYFLRMTVVDSPGVLADISKIFGDKKVSIMSVIQKDSNSDDDASLIVITHKVKEVFLQNAVKELENLDSVEKVCSLIRVGLD